ncbi:MAG: histone deacetylase [Cyanobacteria bacterium P01_A01_bin.135]
MLPIFYSPQFLDHDTGLLHPENPGRLSAVVAELNRHPLAAQFDWRSPTSPEARSVEEAILAVHTPRYIEQLRAVAAAGGGSLDADTVVSPRSFEVAQLAVSAWLDAVDYSLQHRQPSYALTRPPGHHALADRGMGFCLLSNAAIAAHYALTQPGVERVAILDWDVHHGNGTQAIVEAHPQIAYCSLHEYPHYPGTGSATEVGQYDNVLNIPMPAGSGSQAYEAAMGERALPFLRRWQADILIISAGYDAGRADPLSHQTLAATDYGQLTQYCLELTPTAIFGLEGGYDHSELAACVAATAEACLEASSVASTQ